MEFMTRDVIKPVMDFISTCPFLEKYHIDLTPSGTQKLITARPDGSAIDYAGSIPVMDSMDVAYIRRVKRQANFQLWLLRKSNHNVLRQEIADFLFNFEQWVEHCQYHGLCPKLSLDESDQRDEVMWADNGVYFAEWENREEASLYLVQLHISYFNSYNNEEEDD